MKRYFRHSRATTSSKRWRGLRHLALQRDGFRCRKCGAVGRLEVDHIKPERTHPELRWSLENLQSLCRRCHSAKTAKEIGFRLPSEGAQRWATAVKELTGSK